MRYFPVVCSVLLAGGMAFAQTSNMGTNSQNTSNNNQQNSTTNNSANSNSMTGQNPMTGQNEVGTGCINRMNGESQSSGTQSTIPQSRNNQMEGQSQEQPGTAVPNGSLANQNPRIERSTLAVRVLQDTNRARKDVEQQDKAAAEGCIADALNSISQIEAIQPADTNENAQSANRVPIYTEFGQVSVLGPVAAEQRSATAKGNLSTSQPNASQPQNLGEASRMAPEQNNGMNNVPQTGTSGAIQQQNAAEVPTVQGVAQEFTSVTLNVNKAKDQLQEAENALNNGNFQGADSDLAAVQNGVVMREVAADRPLLTARENLALARKFAKQGQYQDMRAPLIAAADALDNYQAEGTAHSSQAASLSQQIRSFANNLSTTGNANTSNAQQQIDNWWNTTANWTSSQSASR
jgi:hypothetical protein